MSVKRISLSATNIVFLMFLTLFGGEKVFSGVESQSYLSAYEEGVRLIRENDIRNGPEATKEGFYKGIELLELSIQLNPTFVDSYLELGEAYRNGAISYYIPRKDLSFIMKKIMTKKVEPLYRQAMALEPDNPKVLEAVKSITKNEEEKISLLKRMLKLDPKPRFAYSEYANYLLKHEKIDEAIIAYKKHLDVGFYRGQIDANDNVLFAEAIAKTGRIKEAVEIYEKFFNLLPQQTSGRYERCTAFLLLKDLKPYEKFKTFVGKIERLRFYCTQLDHLILADKLERQGKTDEALVEFQRQLEVNPYYVSTYYQLERIYIIKNQWEKAWGAMKQYFEFETDLKEKCLRYRYLSVRTYERFDKAYLSELGKTCKKINDALYE